MTDDVIAKIQGLLGDADLGPQLHGLMGGGGAGGVGDFDIGALFAQLQANPDLLARIQAALGNIDLGAALAGLVGGAGGAAGAGGAGNAGGIDLGGIGDALGGLLGGAAGDDAKS